MRTSMTKLKPNRTISKNLGLAKQMRKRSGAREGTQQQRRKQRKEFRKLN